MAHLARHFEDAAALYDRPVSSKAVSLPPGGQVAE
jgi:hypothetical protein